MLNMWKEIKMICVDCSCDKWVHKRLKIDGWKCACDAFPEGIPTEWILEKDPREYKEYNNGIGYEKKPEESKGWF